MRVTLRALRTLLLPQCLVLMATFLLLFSVFSPNTSLAVLAGTSVQKFIVPASAYRPPSIATIVSTAMPTASAIGRNPNIAFLGTPHATFSPVDCSSRPCIALSFDDGPTPVTTPAMLDVLEQRHVAASFFLVGKNITGNEDIVRRMEMNGLEIGNHTWSHADLTTMTPEQIQDELVRTQAAIVGTGAPLPTLFRPPYGAVDQNVVASAGLQIALWNEDPRDWDATDPAALQQAIVSAAHPGGVIDLHDIHQITVDVMPGVIDQLSAQGYQFVTVSQLLHSRDRPSTEPFYGYAPAQ